MHKHHPSMCSIATTKADIRALWLLPCTTDECIVGGPDEDNNGGLPRKRRKVSQFSTLHKLWTIQDPGSYLDLALTWYNVVVQAKSTSLRSPVASSGCIRCLVSYCVGLQTHPVTPNALAYLASPLGLLLAFRVNTHWLLASTRRVCSGLCSFSIHVTSHRRLPPHPPTCHIPLATRLHCCRLLVAFS